MKKVCLVCRTVVENEAGVCPNCSSQLREPAYVLLSFDFFQQAWQFHALYHQVNKEAAFSDGCRMAVNTPDIHVALAVGSLPGDQIVIEWYGFNAMGNVGMEPIPHRVNVVV